MTTTGRRLNYLQAICVNLASGARKIYAYAIKFAWFDALGGGGVRNSKTTNVVYLIRVCEAMAE